MAKSSAAGKGWSYEVLRVLHAHRPLHRVLDVGAGLGIYSQFRQPGQHWTAIEIWGPFVETYDLAKKYDTVVIGDMRYLDWQHFAPLDLVICGDVLEHMTKEEAQELVRRGLEHSRLVLISIPIEHAEQEAILGNPYEAHVKPDWTHAECVASFPDICLGYQEAGIGVYVLSRTPADAAALGDIVNGRLTAPRDANTLENIVVPSAYGPGLTGA